VRQAGNTVRCTDPVIAAEADLGTSAKRGISCASAKGTRGAGRLQAEHHWRAWDVAGDQRRQRCGDVTR